MKIAVTGGSGFIGTNIVEDLLAKNYTVLNIDWHEPKIPERTNIWKNVDICDGEALEEALLKFKPDYILHLAARTDFGTRF